MKKPTRIFLHGLESSSQGAKARFFRQNFSSMLTPDFSGSLDERMAKLEEILADEEDVILVGSSFGGLMAAIYAIEHPGKVQKLILLAPALNFPDFNRRREATTNAPTTIFIGRNDTVTPPDAVRPAAEKTFTSLDFHLLDDDHLLAANFPAIDWRTLLYEDDRAASTG